MALSLWTGNSTIFLEKGGWESKFGINKANTFYPNNSGNIGSVSSTGTGSCFTTLTHTHDINIVPQASIKAHVFTPLH